MDDVKETMEKLRKKTSPSAVDMQKYVRYLVNVLKYGNDDVYENVSHWDKSKVESTIKEIVRENMKPRPQRYYVSLKEPLEDAGIK